MLSNERFSKKSQGSSLAKIVETNAIDDQTHLLDALTFIESPQGLNTTLYPVQRVIVRCMYGIPFDQKVEIPKYRTIKIWDEFKDNLLNEFVTEEEFLHWAYEEGKCNIKDWRDIPAGGFREGVIFAGRRGGKAIDVNEPIPTPNGFVRNGDLKDGDWVFSPSGNAVRVKFAHESFVSKVYRVYFDDGTSVLTHPEHLWLTRTKVERRRIKRRKYGRKDPRGGQNKLSVVGDIRTTEEILQTLKHGKEYNHSLPMTRPLLLGTKKLLIDPYCLGVWLGDGNKDCGIITLKEDDALHIMPNFTSAGYQWRRSDKDDARWHVYGLPLRQLKLHKNKHIPSEYLWASEGQRLSLLQGLMDSDGYCAFDGRCEFTNTNKNLAEAVYHLAASLGLKPHWREDRATLYGKDCGANYSVSWTATLPCFRLPRKLERLPVKLLGGVRHRKIISVEEAGEREVRCITVDSPDGLFLFGKNFNVTHNSQLVAAIGAYELYRLLSLHNPQKYYDLKTSDIDFTFLAQDDKGATRLYTAMRGAVNETPFFTPYIRVNTNATMAFVSEADRDRRDIIPTIKVVSLPCTTNAVRGPSSRFLALDEFAHFASKKGATSEEVYGAATPATSNFVNPQGKNEDMILCISSPWKKIGKMYDLWKQAMDEGVAAGKFALNICTSIMNPRITASKLHTEYKENTMTFKAEFGGSFLDSAESYVRHAAFNICVDTDRVNAIGFQQMNLGREFFWGLDLGMKNDATALAIGHFESRPRTGIELVYDYIDRMMVGEKFVGPGIKPGIIGDEKGEKYVSYPELPLQDIIDWLLFLNRIMPCTEGVTDQHGGSQLCQLLQMQGILNMKLLHITPRINSQMFFALKGYIDNTRCRFPDERKFAAEIGQVEAEMLNKYTLKVAAPMEKGAHDDMVDAAAMVAFIAQQYLNDHKRILLDPTGQTFRLQEQQAQTQSLVIPDISGASIQEVRLAERLARIKRNTSFPGIETTQNPWNKKLGAGRHGRR